MGNTRRWSAGVVAAFFCLVAYSGLSLAVPPPVIPIELRNLGPAMDALNGRITYQIGKGNDATYLTKGISFSGATLASLGKVALKGGVYNLALNLAMNELIDGAGYLWDELNEQVTTSGESGGETCENGHWYNYGIWTASGDFIACDYAGVFARMNANYPGWYAGKYDRTVVSFTHGAPYPNGSAWRQNFSLVYEGGTTNSYFSVTFDGDPAVQDPLPPQPVTDQQLGQQIVTQGQPQLWHDLLTDQTTGMPITTPEVAQQIWDIQKMKVEESGGDPDTVPEPVTVGDLETATSEEPLESDWPDFCAWAGPVCDWIEWSKEEPSLDDDEHPPLPVVDLGDTQVNWNSGLPSAGVSCPEPVSVEMSFVPGAPSIEFSYEPICSGATMVKPIFLAAAYFLAAMLYLRSF